MKRDREGELETRQCLGRHSVKHGVDPSIFVAEAQDVDRWKALRGRMTAQRLPRNHARLVFAVQA